MRWLHVGEAQTDLRMLARDLHNRLSFGSCDLRSTPNFVRLLRNWQWSTRLTQPPGA